MSWHAMTPPFGKPALRWTRTGAPLRPYDVQQAQYRASSDPVP